MFGWVVEHSLRAKTLVLILAAVLAFVGFEELKSMPRDVLPEFGPTRVEVQTEAIGLSAEEVEQLITVPLEQDLLNGVAFLDSIYSESIPGLSSVELIFEPGTDELAARQVVGERLTQAHALPNVSKPPQLMQPVSSTNRVMIVGISSKNISQIDLSVLARWNIKPRLMSVPGVSNVSIWGNRDRQLQVQVDPEQLFARGVTLSDVISTAGNSLWVSGLSFLEASTPGTGGFIDTPSQRLGVQHFSPIKAPADLAAVPLERQDVTAPLMKLSDVARVVEDHQPLIGDSHTSEGPTLMLVIEKFPGTNVIGVTKDVEKALDSLAAGLSGVKIDKTVFRPASYIESATRNMVIALLLGVALSVLIVSALMREWRVLILSLASIAAAIFVAALVLFAFGETLNVMIIAGLFLALAVLIDDSVRAASSMRQILRTNEKISASSVAESTLETRRSLVYPTVIILILLIPVAAMNNQAGDFLPPFALAYAVALLSSVLVALCLTPVLYLLLFAAKKQNDGRELRESAVSKSYMRGLRAATSAPRTIIITVIVVSLIGLMLLPFVNRERSLLPSFKDRDILIHWEALPGTSLPEMNRITGKVAGELRAVSGVKTVGTHVGRAIMSDQVANVNSGEIWINIDESADYNKTISSLQEIVEGYPGFGSSIASYSNEVSKNGKHSSVSDITVRVYGQDLGVLRKKAEEIRQIISEVDGVVDPRVNITAEEPTVEIQVDLARAQPHGIKPGDVRRAAATLLSGIEVGNLFEEQKVFDVVVWGTPEARSSPTGILNLLIDTPSGGHVRLGQVANAVVKPAPNVIRHEAVSRSVDVTANISGANASGVASKIDEKIRQVAFPLEHHAELKGGFIEQEATKKRFTYAATITVIGVFLLLQAAFNSWRLATVMLLILPIALFGSLIAVWLNGGLWTLGAFLGLLGVLAFTIRSLLLHITLYQDLDEQAGQKSSRQAVLQASEQALMPILLGALAILLLFLPILLLGSRPGFEILQPMAVSLIGGIAMSTLITLFVVPAAYLNFGANQENVKAKRFSLRRIRR